MVRPTRVRGRRYTAWASLTRPRQPTCKRCSSATAQPPPQPAVAWQAGRVGVARALQQRA
eukprot:scaffold8978_cov76-Isochrysis_galbana.AAC.2